MDAVTWFRRRGYEGTDAGDRWIGHKGQSIAEVAAVARLTTDDPAEVEAFTARFEVEARQEYAGIVVLRSRRWSAGTASAPLPQESPGS